MSRFCSGFRGIGLVCDCFATRGRHHLINVLMGNYGVETLFHHGFIDSVKVAKKNKSKKQRAGDRTLVDIF